jgi:hypothetical protein
VGPDNRGSDLVVPFLENLVHSPARTPQPMNAISQPR